MNKRGQFYIILAVIISLAFFTIIMPQNKVKESVLLEDFNDVSFNYLDESPKVANYGIYNELDMKNLLSDFSSNFLKFAQQKNPSLELVYIYNNGTNVTIKSYARESMVIETGTETQTLLGAQEQLTNNINLKVVGKDFTHQVPLQIKNFGDEFSTADFKTSKNVILNLGGVFHNFDLNQDGPQLNILLRSKTGSIIQIYQSGTSATFPVRI